jgi:hypothetical protein
LEGNKLAFVVEFLPVDQELKMTASIKINRAGEIIGKQRQA